MSNSFSNIMLSLTLGASLLLASCGKKDNSNNVTSNAADFTSQDVNPSQEVKNIITADKPYVSDDLSLQASTESKKSTVYFLVNDLKPVWGVDQYKTKGTDFTVLANLNDKVVPIVLTGSKDGQACGIWNMNDGIQSCYSDTLSVLTVKFDPIKNPGLENGLYTGKFEILAKGWHNPDFEKVITIDLSIDYKSANLITVDKPFVSKDLSIEASTESKKSSVYFLVNDLKAAWGIGQYVNGTDFTVYANFNDKLVPIILNGSTDRGCGRKYMNDAAICYSNFISALTVKFDPAKNPNLESGLYTAKFNILAKGWHNSSYSKTITLDVELDIKK
ncbi:hypothetical protein GCL60_12300 [Silvanigrella paludirubra]|uniref:DUF4625 domain-containing protein n=1 Tax=Silvanigrella paludirubra TaxID=2499159 RepID=A0A6N6VTC4_9BACT|nr:hypothetical protein [Silvanigrella paludirubra]KAB8037946.1 hypothetical protein GCL60_12300 [Silvanigrella paludirubra]